MEKYKIPLHLPFHAFQIEERLEAYMNSFDIVLIDDQTMDVARAIVDQLK